MMSNDMVAVSTPVDLGQRVSGGSGNVAEWNIDHEQWLRDHPHEIRDIGRQSVTGQDLSGINMEKISTGYLKSDFSNNIFNHSIFRQAKIKNNDFSKCEMNHVNMAACEANHASFSGIKAQNIDFTRANISYANFADAVLQNPVMQYSKLNHASFWGATIDGLDLRSNPPDIQSVNFQEAKLHNANFSGSTCLDCNFNHADLRNADFTGASLGDVYASTMVGADLRSAKFIKGGTGNVKRAHFNDADLSGADFSGHEAEDFKKIHFSGAKYDDTTIFPDGVDPEKLGMIKMARQAHQDGVVIDVESRPVSAPGATADTVPAKPAAPLAQAPRSEPEGTKELPASAQENAPVAQPQEDMFGVQDQLSEKYALMGMSRVEVNPDWTSAVEKGNGPPRRG